MEVPEGAMTLVTHGETLGAIGRAAPRIVPESPAGKCPPGHSGLGAREAASKGRDSVHGASAVSRPGGRIVRGGESLLPGPARAGDDSGSAGAGRECAGAAPV